ncbi:MAG: hypothetical protein NVSMB64_32530 [Candidatus Velthaea sp.]
MKLSRALVASLALPAALSLAACGGSSSTAFGNVTGQQSQLRFVNGAPGAAGTTNSFDIYYNTTGTSATSVPIQTLAYGGISDFSSQVVGAAQIFIRPAGAAATSATLVGSCSLPQTGNNEKDTVVIVNSATPAAGQSVTCALFKDFDFSAASGGQYRVHHASPAAAVANPTVSFGTTNGAAAATFTVAGTATFPGTTASNPTSTFASVGVNGPVSAATPVGFAIGKNGNGTASTIAQINANQFVSPGTATQPDTANTLPGGGFNNASIFAIDCNSATTPQGSACVAGVGLIGSFDNK